MPLSELQQRFVDEYLVDLNATQAYIRAGYKARGNAAETNASRLLRNAQVKASVKLGRQAQAQRTEVTADWVIDRLRVEAEREGVNASHSARVQALHLLGKHQGLFKDDPPPAAGVNVNVTVGVPFDPSKLSDDQLRQMHGLLAAARSPGPGGVPAGG